MTEEQAKKALEDALSSRVVGSVEMGGPFSTNWLNKYYYQGVSNFSIGESTFKDGKLNNTANILKLEEILIDGNDIVYHGYFDIGIAVSTERGLVVPVLRDADTLTMAEIELGEKNRISHRAKALESAYNKGFLEMSEMQEP